MNSPLHLIPQPKTVVRGSGTVSLAATVSGDFMLLHDSLTDYVRRLFGITLSEEYSGAIRFTADSAFKGEAYALYAENGCAEIRAWTKDGARNGMATLLQLLFVQNGTLCLPAVRIEDAPDCAFRSVMIDLARDFHPFSYLLSYVDLCMLYKIPVLQLHFTDDQSYTLPSRLFPKLSTPGRHYTFAEIDALNRYAVSRGVHIMPEIDVPGHCRAFCQEYGDIFGKDGIITRTEQATTAMQQLFCELCDMFPQSERIHIGGDEAAIAKWTEDPACRDYALSQGIDFDMEDKRLLAERLLADFVEKMAENGYFQGTHPHGVGGLFRRCKRLCHKRIAAHELGESLSDHALSFGGGLQYRQQLMDTHVYCYSRGILDAGGGLQLEYAHLGSHAPRLPLSR